MTASEMELVKDTMLKLVCAVYFEEVKDDSKEVYWNKRIDHLIDYAGLKVDSE